MCVLMVTKEELDRLFWAYCWVEVGQNKAGTCSTNVKSYQSAHPDLQKPLFTTIGFSTHKPNDGLSSSLRREVIGNGLL